MQRILVPVDGSELADNAVREVIRRAKASAPREVHLVNVQPRIFPEMSMVYMSADKIDSYYYEQGTQALVGAEKLLREAGISYTAHRAVGDVAQTIVEKARELGCDAIVMSTRGHGKIAGMLLGSVSTKVLHLSDVPVTLVSDKTRFDFTGRLQAT
jgi:nucleotide-binding universal stress UspA family protein